MYVPGPPYCTYGLRAPASCVLYVPELKEASGEPADPACFPHRLHHNPDAHDDAKHSVSCHRALQLYRRHFGEDPPVHTWDFGDIGPPRSSRVDVLPSRAPVLLTPVLRSQRAVFGGAARLKHLLGVCLVALGCSALPGAGPPTGISASGSKPLERAASKVADPAAFAHLGPASQRTSTRRLRSGRAPRHRAALCT